MALSSFCTNYIMEASSRIHRNRKPTDQRVEIKSLLGSIRYMVKQLAMATVALSGVGVYSTSSLS